MKLAADVKTTTLNNFRIQNLDIDIPHGTLIYNSKIVVIFFIYYVNSIRTKI